MTTVPAGDSTANDADTHRLVTIEELEARLDRLEQLRKAEHDAVAAGCPHHSPPADRPASPAGTTVIFSDEPCVTCGEPLV